MKFLLLIIVFLISNSIFVTAQCASEPTIEQTGKIIATSEFTAKDISSVKNEIFLTIEAAAKNSSWAKVGAESAVLTVFVDGKYNQDIILFAGAEKFAYLVALGSFERGKHKIAVLINETRSAKTAKQVKVYLMNAAPLNSSDKTFADSVAIANSPIIYARPDTIDKFSDILLLTYYEIFPIGETAFKIRYTAIYSNEDGGTQTTALMARWGRATDIEWVYEIEFKDGNLVSEVYQGANHETKKFAGKRVFGNHPLIFDVTVNNNFSDTGCSKLRLAQLPIKVDLSKKSRETIMDENEWTYRVMAQEASREGRINAAKLDANTIADPRDYVYAEIYSEPKEAAIALEAETSGGEKFSSDLGNAALRVSRNGFVRIAMRLPKDSAADFPAAVTVACYAAPNYGSTRDGSCQNLRLIKLVRLDQNYLPVVQKLDSPTQNVKVGEKAVFLLSQRKQAIFR